MTVKKINVMVVNELKNALIAALIYVDVQGDIVFSLCSNGFLINYFHA